MSLNKLLQYAFALPVSHFQPIEVHEHPLISKNIIYIYF